MEAQASGTLTHKSLIAMVKSNNPEDVAEVERIFEYLGSKGVALLMIHAGNTRHKLEHRLRFLRLARSIDAEGNAETTSQLKQLLGDKHREIVEEAIVFLFEITPRETAAVTAFLGTVLHPSNIRKFKKRLKSRRDQEVQNGDG